MFPIRGNAPFGAIGVRPVDAAEVPFVGETALARSGPVNEVTDCPQAQDEMQTTTKPTINLRNLDIRASTGYSTIAGR
jgi:hypothetical protein